MSTTQTPLSLWYLRALAQVLSWHLGSTRYAFTPTLAVRTWLMSVSIIPRTPRRYRGLLVTSCTTLAASSGETFMTLERTNGPQYLLMLEALVKDGLGDADLQVPVLATDGVVRPVPATGELPGHAGVGDAGRLLVTHPGHSVLGRADRDQLTGVLVAADDVRRRVA